jgi:hypothetical protein
MFKQKMRSKGLDGIVDKMHTLIAKVNGQPNCIRINSYRNCAVTVVVFVCNAWPPPTW